MYFLAVSLYEFGQFLQILLWISLPMVLIALLVTTYLHYRKKRRQKAEEDPQDGYAAASDRLATGLLVGEPSAALPEESGNAYRGLLWMKDKYEQYREQTDRKYEKLKEDLARSEEKYLELLSLRNSPEPVGTASYFKRLPDSNPATRDGLPDSSPATGDGLPDSNPAIHDGFPDSNLSIQDSPPNSATGEVAIAGGISAQGDTPAPQMPPEKDRQISFLQNQLDQRIKNYHQLEQLARRDRVRAEETNNLYLQAQQELQELQAKVAALNQQLEKETGKVTDLTGKLENNIRLLLHIHQELDKSLEKRLPGNEPQPVDEMEEAPVEDSRSPLPEDTKIVAWVECEEVPEGARQTG